MILNRIPFIIFFLGPVLPVLLFFLNIRLFIIFFFLIALYSFYKLSTYVIFSIVGFLILLNKERVNWKNVLRSINEELPIHLIAIAVNKESFEVLEATIKSISKQDYLKEKIIISISFEERNLSKRVVAKVKELFEKEKFNYLISAHPNSLEGEVPGAASNKKFAVTSAVKKFKSLDPKNTIVTIPDADTVFHSTYFSNLSYLWITNKDKHKRFFQSAFYKVQNNYRKLRLFSKIISTSLTLSILSSSVYLPSKRYTFSCFSLSLSTLKKVDYWDASIGIDDTPFYWRPYKLFNANWKCIPVYSHISVHGIYEPEFFQNLSSQYKQFYRWGYGIIAFSLGLKTIWSNKKIGILVKLRDSIRVFESMIIVKISFITTIISSFLYSYIGNDLRINFSLFSLFPVLVALLVVAKLYLLYYSKIGESIFNTIKTLVFEIPLNIINLLVFSYVPYAHAAMHLAMKYNHHEKITWSDKN